MSTLVNMQPLEISDYDYSRLSQLIEETTGIKMVDGKKVLLQGRLRKRLKQLQFTSFSQYTSYLFDNLYANDELDYLINSVATNKTNFFRENDHFEYLDKQILSKYARTMSELNIWSAGCSSGEEPYTIAMVIEEYIRSHANIQYKIVASDISTAMLNQAELAVYEAKKLDDVPINLHPFYILKAKDPQRNEVRIVPKLRNKVHFRRINFMHENYDLEHNFDIIFFRNVLIYFNQETQIQVLTKIIDRLNPGGYLFLGHAESLFGFDLPLISIGPSIYIKKNN